MGSGINMLCFSACYALALALEVTGFWTRVRIRRVALFVVTAAGIVAHSWYLGWRIVDAPMAPLATHKDWYLLAAWALAAIYLLMQLYYPRASTGLFLLPVILGLIVASRYAIATPLASSEVPRIWGRLHAIFLIVGTVAVLLGFLTGLMYLIQSYRLKHKMPRSEWLQLPSLEWLERVNSRSLGIATLFVGGGFLTGVLSRMAQQRRQGFDFWTDPVVISLGAMLLWLLVAEGFRMVYPAARQGKKVAYLTIAATGFLLIVLASLTLSDSLHMAEEALAPVQSARESPSPLPVTDELQQDGRSP